MAKVHVRYKQSRTTEELEQAPVRKHYYEEMPSREKTMFNRAFDREIARAVQRNARRRAHGRGK